MCVCYCSSLRNDHPCPRCVRLQVKAASNTLRGTVGLIKGGEDLLLLAGWVPKVRRGRGVAGGITCPSPANHHLKALLGGAGAAKKAQRGRRG